MAHEHKKVVIVPCDGTILCDGKHYSCEDMKCFDIRKKTEALRPKICVHAVHYDADENGEYAIIEWQKPKNTIITKEKFLELFGHCLDAHTEHFDKLEKERLEWEARDKELTARIEADKAAKGK